ncbi:MAG TPA: alpha/beta hydrolase [Jatrophihabitans sp.]|nr:alpha/beta hydrolase [Jatrophihabitans sp.]
MPATFSTITTADGRTLEYLTTGPIDGQALLFHVGTPNAATDYAAITEAAAALGLRTICYSRPGYGGSTPLPGRRVADAAADVRDLLDQLSVTEFWTLGWSGGGPHALACAALLPERCRAAALLASAAPYPARGIDYMDGMGQDNIEEFDAAIAGWDELTGYLRPLIGDLAGVTGGGVAESLAGLLSGVDRAALTGALAEQLADGMRRAVQTGMAGWRDDDLAFVQDWGFELGRIGVPVAVWQGRQDRMVPFAHGQWLVAQIPTAEPHLYTEEGHFSLVARCDDILADLLKLGG